MKKLFFNQKGYTVIELLSVLIVFTIIGSVLAGMIYSTLMGTNKATTSNTVSQNGNYALSVISDTLLGAECVINISDAANIDDPTKPDCGVLVCPPSPNGYSGSHIKVRNINKQQVTISCTDNDNIVSNGKSLLNSSQVKPASCASAFICTQEDSLALPKININFTLSQKGSNNLLENKASANFKTSIILRNR